MSDEHHRLLELLPAYALGALEGEELAELSAHLQAGCITCQRELGLLGRDLERLAAEAPPVEPSAAVRSAILEAIRQPAAITPATSGAAEPRPGRGRWLAALAAAAALVLAAGGLSSWQALRREVEGLQAERARLEAQLGNLRAEVQRVRSETAYATAALEIVSAPHGHTVALAGLAEGAAAHGRTYVDPERRRALFLAYDLPALPDEKTYQLWFIADGKPVSAGTFAVDPRGSGRLDVGGIAPPESIQAWAVTVEPAGGVPQPTGSLVLKG